VFEGKIVALRPVEVVSSDEGMPVPWMGCLRRDARAPQSLCNAYGLGVARQTRKEIIEFAAGKRSCLGASVRYNERMKTLTITEGRGRLGYWLKKAMQGKDVGFVFEGKIVALRPVEVVSTDYALQEYGLTPAEMKAAEKRISADLKTARARGEMTRFTGSEDDFR
jgi:hypothetical protein